MVTKQAQVNKFIGINKKGDKPYIEVDAKGIPLQRFWRSRFSDGDVEWPANKKTKITNNNKGEK